MTPEAKGAGTRENPWQLTTPPGKSEYQMWKVEQADPPALVCQVGATQLRYHLRAIEDLHAMLKAHGDWMPPLLKALGLAELTHEARGNQMRAR